MVNLAVPAVASSRRSSGSSGVQGETPTTNVRKGEFVLVLLPQGFIVSTSYP